jgi:hypothetical protein
MAKREVPESGMRSLLNGTTKQDEMTLNTVRSTSLGVTDISTEPLSPFPVSRTRYDAG